MNALIDAAFSRGRTVVLAFVMILAMGASAYLAIPKESEPDIPIPTIYVSVTHEGISPGDAERLLVRPMEKELQSIEGIKEMRAVAGEGYASVTLEFDAGFDADQALQDVREKVDLARPELPPESDEPRVNEVNIALFPVLTVVLSGTAPERTLVSTARSLKDKIETLPGVLEVDIGGDREEVMEVIADPSVMETYDISYADLFNLVQRNNRLVAAGALDTGAGRMVIKVPGVIEEIEDVLNLPVKVDGSTVVTFKDVATVRRTFKDPQGYARVGGQPAVVLEVSKRSGANIIETIGAVRATIEAERAAWPPSLQVSYLQDKSERIRTMLGDLQNNVLTAIVLVMIVIVAALGPRPAILVGLAIPGSFLAGMLVLKGLGLTLNIVVLFSLILVVGMLVDGAIVTTELADRKMAEGAGRKRAYAQAAKRMAWPIIASTATTLAVFVPLLFWPGVVGEFMKFLPITLLITLSASLLMALIFIPALGALIGKASAPDEHSRKQLAAAETGNIDEVTGFTGAYLRVLKAALRHPGLVLLTAFGTLIGVQVYYASHGNGVEFFPDIEPDIALIYVHARGDLSVDEKKALVVPVEREVLAVGGFSSVYTFIGQRSDGSSSGGGEDVAEDVIGTIQVEFKDWMERRPASAILADIVARTRDFPGIYVEPREEEAGPPTGKAVQIQLRGRDRDQLDAAADVVEGKFRATPGLIDVDDTRDVPGIEWRLAVDRAQAAKFGADVSLIGRYVQLVTKGMKITDYRPDDSDEEVDVVVRYPVAMRTLEQLDRIRMETAQGLVSIGNFVRMSPEPKTGIIRRVDGLPAITVRADVAAGVLPDDKVRELRSWLQDAGLPKSIEVTFKGEDKEQREAQAFLGKAFGVALFIMAIILVTQFNSFYSALLILSAVIMSTIGVMMGLIITGNPFGIVMTGIGVIALAGIVVNNNIVLIDTFDTLKKDIPDAREAILRTGAQRLRPVMLTTVTTILGLMPMVLQTNIDFVTREVTVGAPSTQWWVSLSTAIVFGLAFATVLTLVVTPAALMLKHNVGAALQRRRERRRQRRAERLDGKAGTTPAPELPHPAE